MNRKKVAAITILLAMIFNIVLNLVIGLETQALSASYTQTLKTGIEAFPESYKEKIKLLSELHPNWEFKAYYTGIDWNELTSSSAENKCRRNTIHKGNIDPNVLCICGYQGDSNYFCGSANTVNFFLDPRNFLEESMVFQFLELSYSESVTKEMIQAAVAGTYLDAKIVHEEKEYTYTDVIMEAAKESGVNPLHIVVTIFQELGKKAEVPKGISGTYPGYEGLYNFFNYGSTDGTTNGKTPTEKGLDKARSMEWKNPYFALKDGVKTVLSSNYILAGQTTKYFYKFDVVGNDILKDNETKTYDSGKFFSHQYMTNLQDPCSQAGSLFTYYTNCGMMNEKLTFVIPVFENMPDKTYYPTSLTEKDGELYRINTSKIFGVTYRSEPSSDSASLGSLYKYTVVAVPEISGNWAKVVFNKVTDYDAENKVWNYIKLTGYVSKSYLEKIDLPTNEEIPPEEEPENPPIVEPEIPPVTNSTNMKIDNEFLLCIPGVNLKNIKEVYPNATVKNDKNEEITSEDAVMETGYLLQVEADKNEIYKIVVLGDVNGDGLIKTVDYMMTKNIIMETENPSEAQKIAADVSKDGQIKTVDYMMIKNHIMEIDMIKLVSAEEVQ